MLWWGSGGAVLVAVAGVPVFVLAEGIITGPSYCGGGGGSSDGNNRVLAVVLCEVSTELT